MARALMRSIPLVFWRSDTGREPVREWLSSLPRSDKRTIGRDLAKVQFGRPIGLLLCRPLSGGLWEVRSSLPSRREARVFFGFSGETMVALHAFNKKSQMTPKQELAVAGQRAKELG